MDREKKKFQVHPVWFFLVLIVITVVLSALLSLFNFQGTQTDVSLGSDAFFPFGDNIERANKSGVKYIAQPGGSIRDDNVIETCNKYNIAMCFTGMRLFHH